MKLIRVTVFCFLIAIFAPPAQSRCGPFRDPGIPDGETLHYAYQTADYPNSFLIDVKRGEEISESSTRTGIIHNGKGHKIYRTESLGRRKNGYRFEQVSEIIVSGELRALRFMARDRNPEGRVIRQMEALFDDPTLSYPTGTFPAFSLVQVFRGTPFQSRDPISFHVWISPTEIFRMLLQVTGQETIQVPAGSIPCYCVEMKPDIRTVLPVGSVLARLLGPFMPKYRFWFSKESSHPLVKFEGTLGGAGAAKHTIVLSQIDPSSTMTSFMERDRTVR